MIIVTTVAMMKKEFACRSVIGNIKRICGSSSSFENNYRVRQEPSRHEHFDQFDALAPSAGADRTSPNATRIGLVLIGIEIQ